MRPISAPSISFSLLTSMLMGIVPLTASAFSDVSAKASYGTAIEAMQKRGVIEGYADGTFRPGATINRAEFLKIVLRSQVQDFEKNTERLSCFPDVSASDWFAMYVCTAKDKSIIEGYPDGEFHPERDINFVEAAKIITLAYKQDLQGGGEWYEPYARALEAGKAIPPTIDRLERRITRGEMTEMMWRLSEGKTDQPTKGYLNVKHPEVAINLSSDTVQKAQSCEDLKVFVSEAQTSGMGYGRDMMMKGMMAPEAADSAETTALPMTGGGDYSQTNIQVAGVDEGDIVKTDGTYLYIVTASKVRIVKAVPGTAMQTMSTIDLEENAFTPSDLYIDGDRLIIIGSRLVPTPYPRDPHIMDSERMDKMMAPSIWPGPWYNTQKAEVRIYDVSDRSKPMLERKVAFEGSTVSSRRIDDKLYVVINNPVRWIGPGPIPLKATEHDLLPTVDDSKGGGERPVSRCSDVSILPHIPSPEYLTVGVIPLRSPTAEVKSTTVLGSAQNVYASLENLYIATTQWNYRWDAENPESNEQTNLFRFAYTDNGIAMEAQGSVPGHLLNQFSMDEHSSTGLTTDLTFRVATTIGPSWNGNHETQPTNNLYILSRGLERIGSIEDIAPGEQIYSVRFIGDRAYMVTFKTVDPLFAIDLSDARNPRILGKLKIPGYSNYLHPYDETHLIGFGKEVDESIDKDKVHSDNAVYYTAVQGMKVALFDVADVEHPKEVSKVVIGERGTDSPLLSDHHALLFDKERDLLSFPIMVMEKQGSSSEPTSVFQGAYVYTLTLHGGFKLRGTITHYNQDDYQKMGGYWYGGEKDVQRIVRIGKSLYTISNAEVQSHTEEEVKKEGEVRFGP